MNPERMRGNPRKVELFYLLAKPLWRMREIGGNPAVMNTAFSLPLPGRELDPSRYRAGAEAAARGMIEILGDRYECDPLAMPWSKDPGSGHEWPGVFFKKIRYRDAYTEENYEKHMEIKRPWEMSRFHHLVHAAQAVYLGSEEGETYRKIIKGQILDWIRRNRYGYGVNWMSAMEAAIRAINWIWVFRLIDEREDWDFIREFSRALFLHGLFIRNNLEWDSVGTTNHYLADLAGLLFLGHFFRGRQADAWREFAGNEIAREMEKQVCPDGGSYEASTSYHRLALELFTLSGIVCRRNGTELPKEYWQRLEKMFRFTRTVVKDNGEIPQVGDNDSGRILPFLGRDDLDHAYLMSIGAVLFSDPGLVLHGQEYDEEAEWVCGGGSRGKYEQLRAAASAQDRVIPSAAFEDSGLYVMREKDAYLCISCGPNGQNGKGGHCHNDKLSFELRANGEDLIVDPGTYVYTSDYRARNLFRSTEYHNTVRVNGLEINEFREEELFLMRGEGKGVMTRWESTDVHDLFEGYHDGYGRLDPPVEHRRTIVFERKERTWCVTDIVSHPGGEESGLHDIELFLHFSEAVKGVKVGEGSSGTAEALLETDRSTRHIVFDGWGKEQIDISEGWISKRYGHRQKGLVLRAAHRGRLPFRGMFTIGTGEAAGRN